MSIFNKKIDIKLVYVDVVDIQFKYVEIINMILAPEKPYIELPKLPPLSDIESKLILKACISARSALSALKQAGELLPN